MIQLLLALAVPIAVVSAANKPAPLLGPVFVSSLDPTKSQVIAKAQKAFPEVLKAAAQQLQFDRNTTFSINVFSSSSNQSVFNYHYQAPNLNSTKIDNDSIYRVGSLSKLLTVYSFLAAAGNDAWNKPVTEFIPELAGVDESKAIDNLKWSEVTVGALAGHLSGIMRSCKYYDI
jgi:CubicO group peptidase (beta-lactamase class C family)